MRGLLVFTFVMTLGGTLAQGHHSIAAAYDRDRPVKLDGVLVQFAMVQPHPYVVVEIKDGRDTARWRGELDNRWELVAIGMKEETLKPGDRVVLNGSIGRNQPRTLYVWRLDRPADGFWYEQVGMSPKIGFR
jgi:hypothetical protein